MSINPVSLTYPQNAFVPPKPHLSKSGDSSEKLPPRMHEKIETVSEIRNAARDIQEWIRGQTKEHRTENEKLSSGWGELLGLLGREITVLTAGCISISSFLVASLIINIAAVTIPDLALSATAFTAMGIAAWAVPITFVVVGVASGVFSLCKFLEK